MVVLQLFSFPSSTNYKLRGFEFGGGGDTTMNSTNYRLEGIVGELSGKQSSTNYRANSGLLFVQMASTPNTPTFVNSGNWYNKLRITIATSGNPADTTYAIAISDDDFTTTRFVQNDATVGPTLGAEDFQTYSAWGGASGINIIGLRPNTTYKVKVKARQGNFTEGPYGPVASATTSNPEMSMDIDIAATDVETSGPYTIELGDLAPGLVTTSSNRIWVDFATNADEGGRVYVRSSNSGLSSVTTGETITSATADLATATTGYGLRGNTVTQTSGGPLSFVSPYNGSGDNVGVLDSTLREILSTSSSIVGGRASFNIKAKASSTTQAASDYTDTLTIVASATF
jgi:hypothetical protein